MYKYILELCIKSQGRNNMEFSPDFFKRETKCGFEISEIMKRAWAAEMEILEVVINICDGNGLQYFADSGTLLGAVRHQGFIPWDDDVDLCMKREDYMKLVKILPKELPPGFAMAGMYADTERMRRMSFHPYIKIVADDQSLDFNEYMKKFHGFPYPKVAVEIFPLDYIPRDPELKKIQSFILTLGFYALDNWKNCEKNGELDYFLSSIENLCATAIPRDGNAENFLWKLLDRVSSLYNEDDADELANYYYYIQDSKFCFQKDYYKDKVYLPFEQIEIAAPCGWHEVLTASYGDYMEYRIENLYHTYPFYGFMEEELVNRIQALGFSGTVEEFCQKVSCGELRVPESKGRFWS